MVITVIQPVNPQILKNNDITYDDILQSCRIINPFQPVTKIINGNASFDNHYHYINFQTKRIKNLIHELMILNDLIDEELFRGLTNVDDIITTYLTFDINIYGNQNMEFLSNPFCDLYFEKNEMIKKFINNYRGRYNFQYHHFERKRNSLKKWHQ
jgi:hypothetical protein